MPFFDVEWALEGVRNRPRRHRDANPSYRGCCVSPFRNPLAQFHMCAKFIASFETAEACGVGVILILL